MRIMSESSRFSALILGSSHVKRLNRFRAGDKTRRHFGFARPDLNTVISRGVGGLKLSDFMAEFDHVIGGIRPDHVFVKIGGNDLCSESVNPTKFVQELLAMCRYIKQAYGVKLVFVGSLPYRNVSVCAQRWPIRVDYNSVVDAVNLSVKRWCAANPESNVRFWEHRYLSNASWRHYLLDDGVHFNACGSIRYYRSIRGALIQTVRSM